MVAKGYLWAFQNILRNIKSQDCEDRRFFYMYILWGNLFINASTTTNIFHWEFSSCLQDKLHHFKYKLNHVYISPVLEGHQNVREFL